MQSMHKFLKLAQERWTGHVTRMPDKRLPKKSKWNEPPHDKTNKMACAPREDSDQPGHLPSLISLRCRMKKAWVLSYPLSAQRRLWSDSVDAQTDLSLRWAQSHFGGFVMGRLKRQWSGTDTIEFHIRPQTPNLKGTRDKIKQHKWKLVLLVKRNTRISYSYFYRTFMFLLFLNMRSASYQNLESQILGLTRKAKRTALSQHRATGYLKQYEQKS